MKKIAIFFALFLFANWVQGQAPQKINYQGVARYATGEVIPNQTIGIRLSVLDGTPGGPVEYAEWHSVSTNILGLFTLGIGGGTPLDGNFTDIVWSSGNKFLMIEIDPAGGNNFTLSGIFQLVSVPYALQSRNTERIQDRGVAAIPPGDGQVLRWNAIEGQWAPDDQAQSIQYTAGQGIQINGDNQISNTAPDQVVAITGAGASLVSGTYPNFTVNTPIPADNSPTNELQTLSYNPLAQQLSISGGNTIELSTPAVQEMKDTDGDTRITVEETPDEDIIRFFLKGTERVRIVQNAAGNARLEFPDGSGNVFLGAGAGENETGSGKLYIDNSNTSTPLLYGDFSNDLLKVNGRMEVTGTIRVQDSDNTAPPAGTIRWNEATQDFEGFTGTEWKSLTKKSDRWGNNAATEDSKCSPYALSAGDFFGASVSISGNYMVAGAPAFSLPGQWYLGRAYIFSNTGALWGEMATLVAADNAAGDNFGLSASISGDYAIVGAFGHDVAGKADMGQAYIFHRTGSNWTQQAVLVPSDGAVEDFFGFSVAISGDYALVGAYQHNTAGNADRGKAYVFVRSGAVWTQQAILIASDGAAGDQFGYSVSLSGDYALIGAPSKMVGGNSLQGQAYVFQRSGSVWTQQAVLNLVNGGAGDEFGKSVSISGDNALLGAPGSTVDGKTSRGQAYIFHLTGSNWVQTASFTDSDGQAFDHFGASVAISGDNAVVGVPESDLRGNPDQGKAYVFHRSGPAWVEEAILSASDGGEEDIFGNSVSVFGDWAAAGAPFHDTGGNELSGQVYFFVR